LENVRPLISKAQDKTRSNPTSMVGDLKREMSEMVKVED